MSSRIAVLFPGQGSQFVGMLGWLKTADHHFMHAIRSFAPLFVNFRGQPVVNLVDTAPNTQNEENLVSTFNAQPALGLYSASCWHMLRSWGVRADFLAGHSFGELVALHAAGAFTIEELAMLSRERGRLLHEAGNSAPSSLAALQTYYRDVPSLLQNAGANLQIANINSPEQTVVGGTIAEIERLVSYCKTTQGTQNVRAIRLKAACAFHTNFMQPAEDLWSDYLQKNFHPRQFLGTVISNVHARPYAVDGSDLLPNIIKQITSAVQWLDTINMLYDAGARIFIEAGPGRVLTGLVQSILKDREHTALALDQNDNPTYLDFIRKLICKNKADVTSNTNDVVSKTTEAQPSTSQVRVSNLQALVQGNLEVFKAFLAHAEKVTMQVAAGISPAEKGKVAQHFFDKSQKAMESFFQAQANLLTWSSTQNFSPPQELETSQPAVQLPKILPKAKDPENFQEILPTESVKKLPLELGPEQKLRQLIASQTGVLPEQINAQATFDSMGLDSITMIEILTDFLQDFPQFEEHRQSLYGATSISEVLGVKGLGQSSAAQITTSLPAPKPLHRLPLWKSHLPKASIRVIRAITALTEHFCKNIGLQAAEVDVHADLEMAYGVDAFSREEAFDDVLRNMPKFRFARRELLQLRTLHEIGHLFLRMDVPDQAPWLPALLEKPNWVCSRHPLRFVYEIHQDEPYRGILPALPQRIILVGQPGEFFSHFVGGFKGCGPQVQALQLIDGKWFFEENQVVDKHDIGNLSKVFGENLGNSFVTLIVFLAMDGRNAFEQEDSSAWVTQLDWCGEGLFLLAKSLQEAGYAGEHMHLAVLGHKSNGPAWAAARGCLKSLAREWPKATCTSLCLDGSVAEILPATVLNTLLLRQGSHDLQLTASAVGIKVLQQQDLVRQNSQVFADHNLPTSPGFLITGGGSGLTAEFAVALAARYVGCRMLVFGRTESPFGLEEGLTNHLSSRQKDILRTAAKVEKLGGTFTYFQADFSKPTEFESIIAAAKKQFGPIHGVVHGAGINDDLLLNKKSLESFRRVLFAKTAALCALRLQLKTEPLQFVVLISSLSALAGTPGQTDYAAANDVLNECAVHWQELDGVRVVSLGWSVWQDVGLANSVVLDNMRALDLDPIATQDGIDLFMQEIESLVNCPDVTMVNTLASVLFSPLSTLAYALGEYFPARAKEESP